MGIPVVLDCDTGTDDAVAILAAVLDPRIDLLGVCTVWGNHDVRDTTDNTLRVLDLVGSDVPVVPGLNGPFAGRATSLPSGRDDIPARLDLPAATSTAHDGHAPEWLADLVAEHPEPVTVVTTGPLSNLAAAVSARPELVRGVRRVVALAGTHRHDGVAPLVERNVWCDPEAAARVIEAGFTELTFVGMDATFAVPLDHADAAALVEVATPAALAAAAMVEQRIGWYDGPAPLHDPLAVALLVAPEVLSTQSASARVELAPGPTYGRTVFDFHGRGVDVAMSAEHDGFVAWLCQVLGGPEPR